MSSCGLVFSSTVGRQLILSAVILAAFSHLASAKDPQVLARAHAHNDYWHQRPLVDALDQGFASVEADVFLVDGKLLVGHDPFELQPERTLEALYLAPLRERVRQHGGSVFGDGTRVTLFVDLKSDGPATYGALRNLLETYADVVSRVVPADGIDGDYQPRAIDVVVSGNRPVKIMAAERNRYASIDGRLAELGDKPPVHLMRVVSESWLDHFQWDGRDKMPPDERTKLQKIVQRVHAQGRRLRFWATPETEACWRELVAADVDLIGTDDLGRLAKFLSEQEQPAD